MRKTDAVSARVRYKHRDRLAGVLALARMEDQGSSNTGSPVDGGLTNRKLVRARPGHQGGGVVRSTVDAG